MEDVARPAVREYIERTSRHHLLDRVLDEELPRYGEARRRLGESAAARYRARPFPTAATSRSTAASQPSSSLAVGPIS
jgi:hypothetical protein